MDFFKKLIRLRLFLYFGEYLIRVLWLIFTVSTLTFIGYFILEYLKIGLISNYFDLNILLVVSIISGFFLIILNETAELANLNYGKLFILVIISLTAGLLSYQYLQNFEKMRYFIPLLVIIATFIITYLHLNNDYD